MAANKKENKLAMWVCFLAYLSLLGYAVFFSSDFGREEHAEYRYNLTLLQEIGRYYGVGMRTGSWRLFLMNVVGNICVFMPFGWFLPVLIEKCRKWFSVLLLSLELSLAVEIVQLITKVGSFDVDDLLLNTIGGIMGYLMYKMTKGRA
jgi:glycopeptide antibiotics resistance protein